MNAPLPQDPDDFCADCALEAEMILAEIEKQQRRENYRRLEFACVGICECGGQCEKCR